MIRKWLNKNKLHAATILALVLLVTAFGLVQAGGRRGSKPHRPGHWQQPMRPHRHSHWQPMKSQKPDLWRPMRPHRHGHWQPPVRHHGPGNWRSMRPLWHSNVPCMTIEAVEADAWVDVEICNIPDDIILTVTMGRMGTRGVGGIQVGRINTSDDQPVRLLIPQELAGERQIAIRMESDHRNPYFAFNWFDNSDTNTLDRAVPATVTPAPTSTLEITATPVPTTTPDISETTAPTKTPDMTQTPAPTTTPDVSVTPTPTDTTESNNTSVDACKLSVKVDHNVALGFPRISGFMPSIGDVRAVVLFADFEDEPATETPQEVFSLVSPGAEEFFKDISYGRMNFKLEPHYEWLRLSENSTHYGEGIKSFEGHREFIQEAVDMADPDVDFSGADLVIVLTNPEAENIPIGPAFRALRSSNGIQADGVSITNGVTSGFDLKNRWETDGRGFLWLNHETGHSMTLPDLYAYDDSSLRFTGSFGLMGDKGNAPEYFAFERWMLGWLDDNQIVCQESDETTTTLSAIETAGGTKAVIVPTGETTAVVVESRRAKGYDTNLVKEGAIVYTIDTSIPSGEGPLRVQNVDNNDPDWDQAPLAVGDSVKVGNVTITVVETTDDGYTVRVSVANN